MADFMSQTKREMRNRYLAEQRKKKEQFVSSGFETVKMFSNKLVDYLVIYRNQKNDHFIYKSLKSLLERLVVKYETQNEIIESPTNVNLFNILTDYLALWNLSEDLKIKVLDLLNLLVILDEKIAQMISFGFLRGLTLYLDNEVFFENVLMLFGNILLNNQAVLQFDGIVCHFIRKVNDVMLVRKNLDLLKNIFWFQRILTVYYGEYCLSDKSYNDVLIFSGATNRQNITPTTCSDDSYYPKSEYMQIEPHDSVASGPGINVVAELTVAKAFDNFSLLSCNVPKIWNNILYFFTTTNNTPVQPTNEHEAVLFDFLWLVNFMFFYFEIGDNEFIFSMQTYLFHLLGETYDKKMLTLLYLQSLNLNRLFAHEFISNTSIESMVDFLLAANDLGCDEITQEILLFIENIVTYICLHDSKVKDIHIQYLLKELEKNNTCFSVTTQTQFNSLLRSMKNAGIN